jgi:hypothetical protein
MSDIITPAEALRMFIRAHDPALADKAQSLEAVRVMQDIKAPGHVVGSSRILSAAWEALYDAVKTGRIRLRGVFRSGDLPLDIEDLEQAIGKLDIWERTLDCTPAGMKEDRIYRNVHCVKASALAFITPATAPVPPSAKPGTPGTRAAAAIKALWPGGCPPELPNTVACRQVGDWLKQNAKKLDIPFVDVGNSTILRALRRKK